MIAYKGFNKGLVCRGYQFQPGENITEEANCAKNGFHSAENPLDCITYYGNIKDSVYCIVEVTGDMDEDDCDSKIASTELRIIKQLTLEELMGWYVPEGLSQMICTDISKDGMLQGPDFGFYVSLKEQWPTVDVTLSGGISCMDDFVKAEELGIHSVIVGKAIYEGRISLKDLESWLLKG